MGGPGAGRVNRHELNAVPKSHQQQQRQHQQDHVGHGDRILVIGGERPAPAPGCRCHADPGQAGSVDVVLRSNAHLTPSPPPLTSLHIGTPGNGNTTVCDLITNNTASPNAVANGTKAANTMSSPPKHRRGFDPNDATVNDYRRYRRVKTRQRGFVCSTP